MHTNKIKLSSFTFVVRDENIATAMQFTFIAQDTALTHIRNSKRKWSYMAVNDSWGKDYSGTLPQ